MVINCVFQPDTNLRRVKRFGRGSIAVFAERASVLRLREEETLNRSPSYLSTQPKPAKKQDRKTRYPLAAAAAAAEFPRARRR